MYTQHMRSRSVAELMYYNKCLGGLGWAYLDGVSAIHKGGEEVEFGAWLVGKVVVLYLGRTLLRLRGRRRRGRGGGAGGIGFDATELFEGLDAVRGGLVGLEHRSSQ